MEPRVMDVVGFIGQFFSDQDGAALGQEELKDALWGHGFSSAEISRAFRWIEDQTLGKKRKKKKSKKANKAQIRPSLRLLTPMESLKITPEAYGFLVSIYESGLLDMLLFEEVVGQALAANADEIGARQMKRIAALTLFQQSQEEWRAAWQANTTVVQ